LGVEEALGGGGVTHLSSRDVCSVLVKLLNASLVVDLAQDKALRTLVRLLSLSADLLGDFVDRVGVVGHPYE